MKLFFGSIQIFQYLRMNKAEINSNIWLYVILSQNPELINILANIFEIEELEKLLELFESYYDTITN